MVREIYQDSYTIMIDSKGVVLSYGYNGALTTSEAISCSEMKAIVTYDYNNDFALTAIGLNGEKTVYSYDNDGAVVTAGALTLAYDPANGSMIGTTLGKVSTSYGYTPYGEMKSYKASFNTTEFFNTSFEYDNNGRIAKKTEVITGANSVYEYGYNPSGELESVKLNGKEISHYTYDSNGNRTFATKNGVTVSGAYDEQDRMTSYGGNSYTYGLNGELATKTVNGKVTKYTYDVFGNLTKVVLPDNKIIEYIVDGRNRRIGKKVDGVFTEGYIYSGQLAVIAKTDGNGVVTDKYVPGGVVKNGVTYRVITDYLGSPRVAVNADTGEVVAAWEWDEFGNLISAKNEGFLPFGFAGGLRDRDTGLVRFGARDYDVETGRWLSKEPLGFEGSSNFYSYCNGEPINWVDVDGNKMIIVTIRSRQMTSFGFAVSNLYWMKYFPTSFSLAMPNVEHHQMFYSYQGIEKNIGFGKRSSPCDTVIGSEKENYDWYVRYFPVFDDELFNQAVENIKNRNLPYILIGLNCQDWHKWVLFEYYRLQIISLFGGK